MGVGLVVLLVSSRKTPGGYVSPYHAGATPPPVPEPQGGPLVVTPSGSPEPGEGDRPTLTYYQLQDSPDGATLLAKTKPLTGSADTEEARLRQAVEAMAEGERAPLPKGTRLLRFKREGKTVVLDLSGELKSNFAGGDRAETLLLNALIATVAQLPEAEKLQIFVDGQAIETLGGNQSLLEPLTVTRR